MYIYLPNGYRNLQGVRIPAGLWSQDYPPVRDYWQEIVHSNRGVVLEDANSLPSGKQAIIGQLSALDTIRKQYYSLTGENSNTEWQTKHLLNQVIELQLKGVVVTPSGASISTHTWDTSDNTPTESTTEPVDVDIAKSSELDTLREEYEALAGKRVYYGWDAETLQAKIEVLKADAND